MKLTLQQNAVSSLHIAIENFKDFYHSERSTNLKKTEKDAIQSILIECNVQK